MPSSKETAINFTEDMKKLENSNDPADVATLAYIWGYPLVIDKRTIDFTTSPNIPPGPTRGPINTFAHARDLVNANFTDVVRPNQDTLYSLADLDAGKTFGDKINLSNTTNADSTRVEIDSDANSVVVTWWEKNQTSNVPVMRVSTDNGKTFGEKIMLSQNGTIG